MQVEFAFAASSAAVVAPRNTRSGCSVEAGVNAKSNCLGMQLAFACTGVVVPVRRFGATRLAGEIAACAGGLDEGVMTFDAFTMASRGANREYVAANMARS